MSDFLVIGVGSIGERHLKNLLQLGVRDLAVHEPRPERRDQIRSRYPVGIHDTLDAAFAAEPKVVLVCSPPSLHVAHVRQALLKGAHVFVEKPLSDSLVGVEELVTLASDKQRVTLVGCNFRFHPAMAKAKALLGEGMIGRVVSARAQFGQYLPDWHPWEDYRSGYSAQKKLGGGIVLDRIHELDYLRWLLGEVSGVSGFVGRVGDLEIDTEDMAEVVLQFTSGAVGSVHVDYLRRVYDCRLEILGTEGILQWCFQEHSVRWYQSQGKKWDQAAWPGADVNEMYVLEMRHFLECVAGREISVCNLADAAKTLDLALRVRKSLWK